MTTATRLLATLAFATGCNMAAQTALDLPPATSIPATVTVGVGNGSLTRPAAAIDLQVEATALGTYVENWNLEAAVFDFPLATPWPLGVTCAKLAIEATNDTFGAHLRVLIRDRTGAQFAVNTRLHGLGEIPRTGDFEWVETFPWNSAELSRLEPWAVQPLAKDPDYFAAPQPPLAVTGFRVILPAVGKAHLQLRQVLPTSGGALPDPYWHLGSEPVWVNRLGTRQVTRFGWGPGQPGPYLKAGDLSLGKGTYAVTWEVLAADPWQVVAQGAQTWTVTDSATPYALPLLPQGLYHLRLAILPAGAATPQLYNLQYLVIRNSRGAPLAPLGVADKPLVLTGPGNVLAPGTPAVYQLACRTPAVDGATIEWQLDSTDKQTLASGHSLASAPVAVDLAAAKSNAPVLWLTARLVAGGRTLDVLHRALGWRSPAPTPPPAATGPVVRKFAALGGQIGLTKGDWEEGNTPIATQATTLAPQFATWLAEAQQVGYNLVELPATWYDLEPLPGVVQFDALDRLVADAKAHNLHVILRVHPNAPLVPDWVPRDLQEDQNHLAHGLWSGGSNLTFSPGAPAMRAELERYLELLAAHYRSEPAVVGYTLSNLFFDHGFHDLPWLGQEVDYSDAARRAFVQLVQTQYKGDLAAVAAAHAQAYRTWEDVSIPLPAIARDATGRLMPRPDRLWLDWAEAKNRMLSDFRLGGIAALRRGDPAAEVGIYASPDVPFAIDQYVAAGAFIALGGMENPYPPALTPCLNRFEPHAKVARAPELVDVGMTNLLFHQPGYNSFFNYWMPNWTLASVPPDIKSAEARIQQWCHVVQALAGAIEFAPAPPRAGVVVSALQNLIYVQQHTFTPRLDDLYKPFALRQDAEKVALDTVNDVDLTPAKLAGRPYVILPYAADVLTPPQVAALDGYVRGGGKLVIEATSGLWSPGVPASNQLGRVLGLPEALPLAGLPATDSEAAEPVAGGVLAGLPLSFRVRNWNPPINTQATPWIHNIPRAYLQPYRLAAALPAGATVVARRGDEPGAYLATVGQGQVLVFVGVVDWLACPGLLRRLAEWGTAQAFSTTVPPDPLLLSSPMTKGATLYVVGRRYIDHELLNQLKGGKPGAAMQERRALPVPFPQATAAQYHVRELLSGRDLGVLAGAALRAPGVPLELTPGEGFILEAVAP